MWKDQVAAQGVRGARDAKQDVGLPVHARTPSECACRSVGIPLSVEASRISTSRPSPSSVAPEMPSTRSSGSVIGLDDDLALTGDAIDQQADRRETGADDNGVEPGAIGRARSQRGGTT
jgi:hypothetical protein